MEQQQSHTVDVASDRKRLSLLCCQDKRDDAVEDIWYFLVLYTTSLRHMHFTHYIKPVPLSPEACVGKLEISLYTCKNVLGRDITEHMSCTKINQYTKKWRTMQICVLYCILNKNVKYFKSCSWPHIPFVVIFFLYSECWHSTLYHCTCMRLLVESISVKLSC